MIKELSKDKYNGYKLKFEYTTNDYYQVVVNNSIENLSILLERKNFPQEVFKSFDSELFQDHWENPKSFGYFINEKLVGIIEVNQESWNRRLRITELLIDNNYRRQGIGKALMNVAKEEAKKQGCRMLILETQTCNTKAIDFYLREGFKLIGIDTGSYSNNDVEKNEVRVEFGLNYN